MEISAKKTKLMTKYTKDIQMEIKVKGQRLGSVTSFKCIKAFVSNIGLKSEFLSSIAQATAVLTKLKPIWRANNIPLGLKVSWCPPLSFPNFCMPVNRGPSVHMHTELEKRTQAFKMSCYQSLLNILYKVHVTNEEVCRKIQAAIGEYDEVLTLVKKRKIKCLAMYQGLLV